MSKRNGNFLTTLLILVSTIGVGYLVYDNVQQHSTSNEQSSTSDYLSSEDISLDTSTEEIKIDENTKTFYESMIIEEGNKQYFTYENNQIITNNLISGTSFDIGTQKANHFIAVDLDLTPILQDENSIISIKFSKWDINSNIELIIKKNTVIAQKNSWNDSTKSKESTSIELDNQISINDLEKFNLKVVCRGYDRKLLINNEAIITINDTIGNAGYFSIDTWQASYTLEKAFYKEYSDQEEFDNSNYYQFI